MGRGVVCLLMASLATGCGDASLGEPCVDDCGGGLVCAFDRCRTGCGSDADCGDDGRCLWDPATELYACDLATGPCATAADCPAPLICYGSACLNACVDDTECGPMGRCEAQPDGARICRVAGMPLDAGGGDADSSVPDRPPVGRGGWRLPAECIPEMDGTSWAPIGRGCMDDSDCDGDRPYCDRERRTELLVIGSPEVIPTVQSLGGTCVASPPGQCSLVGCDACSECIPASTDLAPPCASVDECSASQTCERGRCRTICGAETPCAAGFSCEGSVCLPAATCADRCDLSAPDSRRGGCREGYVCAQTVISSEPFELATYCAPGCSSDIECRALGTPAAPTLRADVLGACDAGVCVNPGGPAGGELFSDCAADEGCAADLYCTTDPLQRLAPRPEAHRQFPGGGRGYCSRACVEDTQCEAGVCSFGLCTPTCVVGADDPAELFGPDGHGAGCPPNHRCEPTADPSDDETAGVCMFGSYNEQTENNVGVLCNGPFERVTCYSPGGHGSCPFDQAPFCTLRCGIPGLPESVCGELAACVDGYCRRRCTSAEDCQASGFGGGIDATFACADAGAGTTTCQVRCGEDGDCPAADRCLGGYCESEFRRCRDSEDGFYHPRVFSLDDAVPDVEGWYSVPFPPRIRVIETGFCDLARIGSVEVVVVDDGVLEAEISGEGWGLRASLRDGCAETDELGCGDEAGTLSLAVEAGQTVWVEGLVDFDPGVGFPPPTALRVRVRSSAGLGEACEAGTTLCADGLECRAVGASGTRCLPAVCGGSGVLVLDLLEESTSSASGDNRVTLSDSGIDSFRTDACGDIVPTGATGQDVFLRYTPAEAERILFTAPLVSVRTTCDDETSELGCRATSAPLRLDEDGSRPIFVLLEARELTWRARPLLASGAACDPRADLCADGLGCIEGTCQSAASECGPGVGVVDLGRLGPGSHSFSDDLRWWDTPICGGSLSGIRVLRLEPTVNVELSAVAGQTVIGVRRDCDDPTSELRCGQGVSNGGPPVTLPADEPAYVFLGPAADTAAATTDLSLGLSAVALLGEACGGSGLPCEASNVCTGGVCMPGVCGDGLLSFPEECEDGNFAPGDGCSPTCTLEEQGPGGDTCATAQTVAPTTAGTEILARYRADPAGATDAQTLTCHASPTVDSFFITTLPPGTYTVESRLVSGRGYIAARPLAACSMDASGFEMGCSIREPGNELGTTPGVPGGMDFAIIAEPLDGVPFVFDLVAMP